jgi:integrase
MSLDQIDRQNVRRLLLKVYKNRSPATVELVHTVIHGLYNDAIEDGIVNTNPASGLLKKILPPKNQRDEKEPEPLDLRERGVFLEYAEKSFGLAEALILKMMLFAGFRLGETLAMRLKNFDFNKMTCHVTESYKQYRFSKPKFGKKRIVDLPDFLVEELKAYTIHIKKLSFQEGKGGNVDLLFLDSKENDQWPYSQRKIQALVSKICKGTGMRHRNPHDLRHTYATIMLMAHQSPAYVQKQLGHSSISITVDTYGHWISGEGRFGLENALLGVYENRTKSHIKQNDPSK